MADALLKAQRGWRGSFGPLPPRALSGDAPSARLGVEASVPEERTYIRSDDVIVPLVPRPYCRFCCKPIKDAFASTECCYDCSQNLKRVAEPPQDMGKAAGKVLKFQETRPYYFRRAGAVGLYVTGRSLLYREIWKLKTEGESARETAVLLAECMDVVARSRFPEMMKCSVIVPVPSGSGSSDASQMLADSLSSRVQVSMVDALARAPGYKSQREVQSKQGRWENPEGKLHVKPAAVDRIRGKKVLLIDDTFVTGGTAHWAAKTILDGGANDVFTLVAGRDVDGSELEYIGYNGRL